MDFETTHCDCNFMVKFEIKARIFYYLITPSKNCNKFFVKMELRTLLVIHCGLHLGMSNGWVWNGHDCVIYPFIAHLTNYL